MSGHRAKSVPRAAVTTALSKSAPDASVGKPVAPILFTEAMDSPALFGRWFATTASWNAWRVFAKALFGLPMTPPEVEVFGRFTGRTVPPTSPAREAWLPVGRRGGKSLFAAALAVFMACFRDYRPHLKPGEQAIVMVLAADKDQASVVFDYIAAVFDNIPTLGDLVETRGKRKESIRLTNRVTIRVQVASFRRLRGRTVVCAILDECAFWYSDDGSRNPDTEIIKALRPSMLTIPVVVSQRAAAGFLLDRLGAQETLAARPDEQPGGRPRRDGGHQGRRGGGGRGRPVPDVGSLDRAASDGTSPSSSTVIATPVPCGPPGS
jgi:hypothetical protein